MDTVLSIWPTNSPLVSVSPSLRLKERIWPFCCADTMTSSDSKFPEVSNPAPLLQDAMSRSAKNPQSLRYFIKNNIDCLVATGIFEFVLCLDQFNGMEDLGLPGQVLIVGFRNVIVNRNNPVLQLCLGSHGNRAAQGDYGVILS